MRRSIIVGYESPQRSDAAMRFAESLARASDARVTITAIDALVPPNSHDGGIRVERVDAQDDRQSTAALLALAFGVADRSSPQPVSG